MDFKLRGMNADRDTAGSGGDVVASQRSLAAFVEFAVTVQGKRVRRDDGPFPQVFEDFLGWRWWLGHVSVVPFSVEPLCFAVHTVLQFGNSRQKAPLRSS